MTASFASSPVQGQARTHLDLLGPLVDLIQRGGSSVVPQGEVGVGKTHLATKLLDVARTKGERLPSSVEGGVALPDDWQNAWLQPCSPASPHPIWISIRPAR